MPRIYYEDSGAQFAAFSYFGHALLYTLVLGLLLNDVLLAIFLWTILLTYHSFAHAPLGESIQNRTYTRLRNRFGVDWDLAATVEEYDDERRKARIDEERRLLRIQARQMLLWIGFLAVMIVSFSGSISELPLQIGAALGGVALFALPMEWWLRRRSVAVQQGTQKKAAEKVADADGERLMTPDALNREPRPGYRFGVGEDGELIEMRDEDEPKQAQGKRDG